MERLTPIMGVGPILMLDGTLEVYSIMATATHQYEIPKDFVEQMQFKWTQAGFNGPADEAGTTAGRSIPGLGFYRYASKQPSWVRRVTFTVFAVVVAIPVILLFLLALLAAGVVFGGLTLINSFGGSFKRGIGRGGGSKGVGRGGAAKGDQAGRSNVRVLPPE